MVTTASAATPKVGASSYITGTPESFLQHCRSGIASGKDSIERLKKEKNHQGLAALRLYDEAIEFFGNVSARAGLAREVHPDPKMREAAEVCEQEVSSAFTDLSLDRGVYDALNAVKLDGADAATKHYMQRTLRDFRLSGVDKDEATRAKVKALRDELVKIGQEFGKNIRDDVRFIEVTKEEMEGLPQDFINNHPIGEKGKAKITTDSPDYQPFMTYAKSDKKREELYRVYRLRAHPKNLDVLDRMLAKRQELATLLGFATWADLAMADKMIATSKNASDFIQKIVDASGEAAERDYKEILEYKKKLDPTATTVNAWESGYLAEKIRAEKYDFDSQLARPYFEYTRMKEGVLDFTSKMFGISYQPVKDAPVWHEDVDVYDVYEGKELLGRIYLDMHPRENKYKHFAQFTLTNGVNGRALPEGVLVCNFPKPGKEPALMDHGDLETLFHEFGHLIHHVIGGHTEWAGISGVSTEWDFVEAPSQILEEWTWEPVVLKEFARHYKTNEAIPAEMVKKMKAAEEFGKGLGVRQQMFYAATSLNFHNRDPKGLDSTKLMSELQEKYTPYKYVPGTYMHLSFGHLDGYSAIYYTYMWSLVLAKDMYTPFKGDPLNAEKATAYRRAVLQQGGSKPAADLVKDFLGREYSFDAYKAWLDQR